MAAGNVECYIPERLVPEVNITLPVHPSQLKFVFGFHQFPDDLPSHVAEQVGHPDLLLVEQVNFVPEFEQLFNQVPRMQAPEVERTAKDLAAAHWLFGRQVELISQAQPIQVGIADLPVGHPYSEPMAKILTSSEDRLRQKVTMSRSVEQMLSRTRVHLDKDLPVHAAREQHMAEDVYRRIVDLSNELDRPVSASFLVGPDHVSLVGLLQQKISDAEAEEVHAIGHSFVEDDLPTHPLADIKRTYYMGEEVSDVQLVKYLARLMLPAEYMGTYAATLREHERVIQEVSGSLETPGDLGRLFGVKVS